jgi:extradiol dioxygenase family protein
MLEEKNMRCLMDHIVLNMEDDDKMIGFYTDILQLQVERLEEYRTGKVPFPSVRLNADTIIDLFPKKMWQNTAATGTGRVNMNHFCLALSRQDWEKLYQRLQANTIPIMEGPVPRWGAHGNGTSIYFRDPGENVIEARYYEGNTDSKGCLLGS